MSPSVPLSTSSPSASHRVGGFHGNLAPFGSSITAERPSVVMSSPVSPSTITNVGIPRTLYFFDSVAFSLRSAYGSASHGISAK